MKNISFMNKQKKLDWNLILENENLLIFDGEMDLDSIRRQLRSLSITYGFSSKETTNILKASKEILKNVILFGVKYEEFKVNKWMDGNQRTLGMEVIVEDFGPGVDTLIENKVNLGFGLSHVEDLVDELILRSKKKESSSTTGLICTLRFSRNTGLSGSTRQANDNWKEVNKLKLELTQTFQWVVTGESIARAGESRNGDKVFWIETNDIIVCTVIDGMGHGYAEDISSGIAIEIIENNFLEPLEKLIYFLHRELHKTVGVQCIIIRIDKTRQIAEYVGIGNIRAFILINNLRIIDLVARDGTLGLIMPHFQIEQVVLNETSTIIAHSDGISRKWLNNIRNLKIKKFGERELVKELIQNFRKFDDDSTILIIQNN